MTNLERIQGMTLKQLAVFILRKRFPCACCSKVVTTCHKIYSPCLEGVEEWLKSVPEGETSSNYDVIKVVPAKEVANIIYMTGNGCNYCEHQDEPCSKGNLDCKHGIEKWLLRKVKE